MGLRTNMEIIGMHSSWFDLFLALIKTTEN